MNIINRLERYLADTEKIPLKDASGKIITPAGFEATIEARVIRRCLRIAKEEEGKVRG